MFCWCIVDKVNQGQLSVSRSNFIILVNLTLKSVIDLHLDHSTQESDFRTHSKNRVTLCNVLMLKHATFYAPSSNMADSIFVFQKSLKVTHNTKKKCLNHFFQYFVLHRIKDETQRIWGTYLKYVGFSLFGVQKKLLKMLKSSAFQQKERKLVKTADRRPSQFFS